MLACDYLARVGFDALLDTATQPEDEDDAGAIEAARLADHRRVRNLLIGAEPKPLTGREGAQWIRRITWPDRLPGLKTWAGQTTLPKIIAKLQRAIREADDLFEFRCPLKGASGIDGLSCPDSLDAGFGVAALDMAISQRPGVELLAILGLELLPLVSFALRECGFILDGKVYRFAVELRDGGYYHRWGSLEPSLGQPRRCPRV